MQASDVNLIVVRDTPNVACGYCSQHFEWANSMLSTAWPVINMSLDGRCWILLLLFFFSG